MRRAPFLLISAIAAGAGAQTAPPKLWTQIETTAPHADVASAACALAANAVLDGRAMPIALDAFEDSAELCASAQTGSLAVRGRVKTTRAQPSTVVVELDVPPGSSARATSDLRVVLQGLAADLARRAAAMVPAPPVRSGPAAPERALGGEGESCRRASDCASLPCVEHVCTSAFHSEKVANVPLIAGGFAGFGAGYFVSLLVGAAIAGASGDPGTSRAWPFVPFIGLTVFSASYKEAPSCDCEAGRAFAMVGSVLVGLVQIAGVVVGVAGLAMPRTKAVPNRKISIRFGPTGLEGSF